MKAYLYQRISSKKQTTGMGLDRQLDNALAYARQHSLTVIDTQQDVASAFHSKHVEGRLGAFLAAIRNNEIEVPSALVVESLDRLGREHELTALSRFIDIVKAGIEIHEISTGIIYNATDTHLLHVALSIMTRAYNESLMKSKRSHDAIQRKLEAAKHGKIIRANVPVWIDIVSVRDGSSDVVDDQLQLNEHAATVKLIFDLYLSGMSFRAIARELNDRDIPYPVKKAAKTMRVEKWGNARVYTMLTSPAVYGQFTPKTGEPIEDYFPAVVDVATYEKVKSIRTTRQVKATKITGLLSLVSSCCVCGDCGHSYICNSRYWNNAEGQQMTINLRCNGRMSGIPCTGKSIPIEVIERYILEVLPDVDISKLNRNKMKTLDNLKAKREQLQAEMENLIDLVAMGSAVAKAKFKTIQERAEQLDVKIEKASQRILPDEKEAVTAKALNQENLELRRKVNSALQLMGLRVEVNTPHSMSVDCSVFLKGTLIAQKKLTWKRKKRIDARS
ncbi:TPA: recombinase family protein [Aeromonas hydrophila subsp. hydrophila]|nr:recombinase family protein [Aeromonas hydrophila subsp. hydrophila]